MATINQVAKKWATRTLKELTKQGLTYNPNEASIAEYGGQQHWDQFELEVKETTDYDKIKNRKNVFDQWGRLQNSPKSYAYDLLEKHAEELNIQ